MNTYIEDYARTFLLENLKKCDDDQFMVFKKMYSLKNLEADRDEVVRRLPINSLDWAMQQVINTLLKGNIELWTFQKTSIN